MTPAADWELAVDMLTAVGGHGTTLTLVAAGQPIPKGRAKKGRGGKFYTPEVTRAAEDALAHKVRAATIGDFTFPANVAVACVFYRADRTTVDGDNLLKLVYDAATTAKLWRDDRQVTGEAHRIELDRENPRTVIVFGEHRSSLDRRLVRVK